MQKYTDGYYIYQYLEFTCDLRQKCCDGCNAELFGFVYELKFQSVEGELVTFCAGCMEQLEIRHVE
ncbi:hypothetical protein B9T27_00850 [Acinetobacter sp. ANC 4648]|nr:hypothetical protein B9T27_00850 [Acinetobacter sp. ANC 4648]